jgi:hypothetical protein
MNDTDLLLQAGQILRGETRLIATVEHLRAVADLVRAAQERLVNRHDWDTLTCSTWLRDAEKVTR